MDIEYIKELLKEETNYCFSDVWYNRVSSKITNNLLDKNGTDSGYVYFVRIIGTNKVKIGFAKNIMSRILSFKTLLTENISLDGFIFSDNYKKIESELHLNNKHKNSSLEWFNLTLKESEDLILNNKGVVVHCKINQKLFIESGEIVSKSESAIKNLPNIYLTESIIKDKIREYFNTKNISEFKATAKDLKNKIFMDNKNINSREISFILQGIGISANTQRYIPFYGQNEVKSVGRAFLLKKEYFA